jgi:6-pyruvoyl-tetrahydropterin synthase
MKYYCIFFRYKEIKTKIKKIFSELKHIALTTDLWKNKTRKYFLGLTAHFFDSQLNYRNLLVGFRSFGKNHKAENIKLFIKDELQDETLEKVQIKLNFSLYKLTNIISRLYQLQRIMRLALN